jgi:hypothetical protein
MEGIEKKCLYCGDDYTAKKDNSKFCSVSCRVMWNRKPENKKPQKGLSEIGKLKVVVDAIWDKVEKMGSVPSQKIAQEPVFSPVTAKSSGAGYLGQQQSVYVQQAPSKSFEQYRTQKREIELPEDWEKLKVEIENDPYLSSKQKTLLTTTNI